MAAPCSILLVDGDQALRQGCRELLESAGYVVFESPGARHARMFLATTTPSVVLIEARLPDQSGVEVVRFMKEDRSLREIPAVLMSSSDDLPEGADLAACLLRKPFRPEQLFAAVQAACGETGPQPLATRKA